MKLFKLLLIIAIAISFSSCTSTPPQSTTWEPVANGVWKYSTGDPGAFDLLEAAKAEPVLQRLNHAPETDFPFSVDEVEINDIGGKLYLKFPLEKDEQIYEMAGALAVSPRAVSDWIKR